MGVGCIEEEEKLEQVGGQISITKLTGQPNAKREANKETIISILKNHLEKGRGLMYVLGRGEEG